jgi:nucleoside-diphosphate-sugar epimerase
MTTLVTGGNGWVPSHIVRRLARRGERVISYDLMEPDHLLSEMLGDAIEQVTFVHGDITDRASLLAAARDHGVTKLIHAAVITPRQEWEVREPDRIIDVNIGGTVNALEVARSLSGFERFVYVSSCAVWGDQPGVTELNEEAVPNPSGLYPVTKLASESICRRYAELFGLDIVSMRPSNVFGPMERDTPGYRGGTELREMLRLYAEGKPILVNSLAGPWRDWTYVEDIAEGIERAWATPNLPHEVYSLTCGHLFSIGDVLEAFKRHLPDLEYRVVPEADANYLVDGSDPGPLPVNTRLRTAFGWTPPTTFDEGMRQYLEWVLANGPQ